LGRPPVPQPVPVGPLVPQPVRSQAPEVSTGTQHNTPHCSRGPVRCPICAARSLGSDNGTLEAHLEEAMMTVRHEEQLSNQMHRMAPFSNASDPNSIGRLSWPPHTPGSSSGFDGNASMQTQATEPASMAESEGGEAEVQAQSPQSPATRPRVLLIDRFGNVYVSNRNGNGNGNDNGNVSASD